MSTFAIDSFLRKGKGHTICEDYILQGLEPFPYIILADGCSSSVDTDIGARIITHITKNNIFEFSQTENEADCESIGRIIINQADSIAKILKLKQECLDATLLILILIENQIYVVIYGDGIVFTDEIGSGPVYYCHEYAANAPYYLSYRLDEGRNIVFRSNIRNNQLSIHTSSLIDKITLNEKISYYKLPDIETIKTILISSDGISTFHDFNNRQKSLSEIQSELMNFKNCRGEFLKRRMNKMINDYERDGIYHFDDISIGGFTRC